MGQTSQTRMHQPGSMPASADDLDVPRGVTDRLGLLIVKVGYTLEERMVPHFEELGIDGRDYSLLAVLSHDLPGSQAQLAALCGLLPAQLVPVLDELESAGFVERRRDERDRRRTLVTITDQGREILGRADEAARGLEAEILGPTRDDLHARLTAAVARPTTA